MKLTTFLPLAITDKFISLVFLISRIRVENGEIRISPYSVRTRITPNTDTFCAVAAAARDNMIQKTKTWKRIQLKLNQFSTPYVKALVLKKHVELLICFIQSHKQGQGVAKIWSRSEREITFLASRLYLLKREEFVSSKNSTNYWRNFFKYIYYEMTLKHCIHATTALILFQKKKKLVHFSLKTSGKVACLSIICCCGSKVKALIT